MPTLVNQQNNRLESNKEISYTYRDHGGGNVNNIKKFLLLCFFVGAYQLHSSNTQTAQAAPTPQDVANGIINHIFEQGQPSENNINQQIQQLLTIQKSFDPTDARAVGIGFAIGTLQSYLNSLTAPTDAQKNQYLYTKNMDHADPQTVDRLTQEAYISPELQWAVMQLVDPTQAVVNTITGQIENIPTVSTLLDLIQPALQQKKMKTAEQQKLKNGVHAMLQATEIAIFVASAEASYQNQKFVFYQNANQGLINALHKQQNRIQKTLDKINAIHISDAPKGIGSYFSWILPSASSSNNKNSQVKPLAISPQATLIKIPVDMMNAIVARNNFKDKTNPRQAANLLFKQCFIAQQHHLKDNFAMKAMAIHLDNPLVPDHYVYYTFPDIYNKKANSYPICAIAQSIVPKNQHRKDIKSTPTQEQQQAHQMLFHIRQAIQTALYIANKKSSFNVGYALNATINSYLDSVVSELLKYDAQLSKLCKDPQYGATQDDLYADKTWTLITQIAAGITVVAVVGGAVYYYRTEVGQGLAAAGKYLSEGLSAAGTGFLGLVGLGTTAGENAAANGIETEVIADLANAVKAEGAVKTVAATENVTQSAAKQSTQSWYEYFFKPEAILDKKGQKNLAIVNQTIEKRLGNSLSNLDPQSLDQSYIKMLNGEKDLTTVQTVGQYAQNLAILSGLGSFAGSMMAQQGDPQTGKMIMDISKKANLIGNLGTGLQGTIGPIATSITALSALIPHQPTAAAVHAAGAMTAAAGNFNNWNESRDVESAIRFLYSGQQAYDSALNVKDKIVNPTNVAKSPAEVYYNFVELMDSAIENKENLEDLLSEFTTIMLSQGIANRQVLAMVYMHASKNNYAGNEQLAQLLVAYAEKLHGAAGKAQTAQQ